MRCAKSRPTIGIAVPDWPGINIRLRRSSEIAANGVNSNGKGNQDKSQHLDNGGMDCTCGLRKPGDPFQDPELQDYPGEFNPRGHYGDEHLCQSPPAAQAALISAAVMDVQRFLLL